MNSRSSVNESNLVNIPADLSNLNQLTQNRKEPLLSFPFDHLYACHSESSQRRQTVELDKEVEISSHCGAPEDKSSVISPNSELGRLADQLSVAESQNRKLKDLLVYHLDLIQQQNDALTKKDKLYQALQIENETLKHRLSQSDQTPPVTYNPTVNPQPVVNTGLPTITSTVVKKEPNSSTQIMFDSLSELLLPDNRNNPYIFNSDDSKDKAFGQGSFDITRSSDADLASFLPNDLDLPSMSLLDSNINCNNFTMIESKPPPSTMKKEIKAEPRSEPLYTVTTNSGNPIIQKIQRNRRSTTGGLGSLSRMPKRSNNVPESSQILRDDKKVERTFSLNKKCKMINTYGKSRTSTLKRTSQFTGSLSDRLRLIDTTPTGEDPYQLGEADMREQSPIPKLMLQKGSHRMRTCTSTSTGTSTRRIYDPAITETISKPNNKMDNTYNMPCTYVRSSDIKTEPPMNLMPTEPVLDIVKTEPLLHWSMYATNKSGNETSLCDFSYGENSNNLASNLLTDLDTMDFPDFFTSDSPLNLDNITPVDFSATVENKSTEKTKKRAARTTSLMGPNAGEETADNKRSGETKRGRKRALSVTGPSKATKRESSQKATVAKPKIPKGKAAANRGKKSPVPGMMTRKTYHTLMGDPDLSWYLGLDPNIKSEDIDPPEINKASTVEVPRWREKPYTSCYTLEGTENLDDRVFEKRHQKLEADERRQLRWHMRRIREQRHVERLRQRQRDPWCGNHYQTHPLPSVYTIWPQPQRDIRAIEITDTLPVMAFGESLPQLPETDFMLPWVRTSKALKRAKRSKTLH